MSNPTTGFICKNSSEVYQDLSGIFQPLFDLPPGATETGFIAPSGNDLNKIFYPLPSGNTPISFNTNFIGKGTGKDLRYIFAPYNPVPFTIEGTAGTTYVYRMVNGFYEIYFLKTSAITFNTNVTGVQIVAVGGGGAGGANCSNPVSSGGGGGGGGYRSYADDKPLGAGTRYTATVGAGGIVGPAGILVSTPPTGTGVGGTSTFIGGVINVTANGGQPGAAFMTFPPSHQMGYYPAAGGAGAGLGGDGGSLGYSSSPAVNATAGNTGIIVTLSSSYQFYIGGGGAGGQYYISGATSTNAAGGLGGGGGNLSNGGANYISPKGNVITPSISYAYPNSGGGGFGQNGQITQSYTNQKYGTPGGSGLVTLCFKWPQ